MKAIGLDIGTTTVCAIVLDTENGAVLKSVTKPNDTFSEQCRPYEKVQNPDEILRKAVSLVDELAQAFSPVACIGVTGQMHGLVYLNKKAQAVSPLYIWQDQSGNEIYRDGKTYAQYLTEQTPYKMASGFGGTTYFVHNERHEVPEDAVTFCTIHDYVAMHLAGLSRPVMHTSDAASYGFFDIEKNCFDRAAIEKAGLCYDMFPEVTEDYRILGNYKSEIPVSVAIGDNQASFIGSVCDLEDCLLVNVGTGSQVSFFTRTNASVKGLEVRPCTKDGMIMVGSSLCGGRAFALLEEFFRMTAQMVTGEKIDSAYKGMDACLAETDHLDDPLTVSTLFSGTRENPDERGSITSIGVHNFTPRHFLFGLLHGMADELKAMYDSGIKAVPERPHQLVGSGNGLRKNKALQKIFSELFGMPLRIPAHHEEAAFGSALFSLTSAGVCDTIQQAQLMIKYE